MSNPENLTNEDIEDLVTELKIAKRKYEKKKGSYMSGIPNRKYTDQVNEARIENGITAITDLLVAFEKVDSLRYEQVIFARKLIKRAFSLGLNNAEKET